MHLTLIENYFFTPFTPCQIDMDSEDESSPDAQQRDKLDPAWRGISLTTSSRVTLLCKRDFKWRLSVLGTQMQIERSSRVFTGPGIIRTVLNWCCVTGSLSRFNACTEKFPDIATHMSQDLQDPRGDVDYPAPEKICLLRFIFTIRGFYLVKSTLTTKYIY